MLATHPSCIPQVLIFVFDVLLLINIFFKKPNTSPHRFCRVSCLQLISAIYNGVLGLGYFFLGVLTLEEKWRRKQTIVPLNWRLLVLFHGLTWLLVSLAVSLWGKPFSRVPMCILSGFAFIPHGDLTEIEKRGVNVSGGQKQIIQLARALYQDADIYLLDDPFSAVDAHTATSLFNEYVMYALSGKTVLLVTHQVDFLPAFDSVLLMSHGEILHAAPYHLLMASSRDFQDLVDAHKKLLVLRGLRR